MADTGKKKVNTTSVVVEFDSKFWRECLQGHARRAMSEIHPNIHFAITDQCGKWYILIHGLDAPFKGGVYLVEIKAPKNYPNGPPEFYFLTPNGVYEVGVKVCIDIGSYHASNFPSSIGMDGFSKMLVQGLSAYKELGGGINVVVSQYTDAHRQRMADKSSNHNAEKYKAIMDEYFSPEVIAATQAAIRANEEKKKAAAPKRRARKSLADRLKDMDLDE